MLHMELSILNFFEQHLKYPHDINSIATAPRTFIKSKKQLRLNFCY